MGYAPPWKEHSRAANKNNLFSRGRVVREYGAGRTNHVFFGEAERRGPNLTNEIRATLVDHVVNHGLTMREAGLRVQPNLSRYTVASVIRAFRQENR